MNNSEIDPNELFGEEAKKNFQELFDKYKNIKKKEEFPLAKAIFGFLFGMLLFVPFVFLMWIYFVFSYGYAGVHLWEWFIVPRFGLEPMTLLQMVGIMLFLRLCLPDMTYIQQMFNKDELTKIQKISQLFMIMISPWSMLIAGYIIHKWI